MLEALEKRTLLAATWTPLAQGAPFGIGTMNLLTDGSVIATDGGSGWARFVPDATGSYINGTWTRLASSHDSRLYDATQVLQDGRLFMAGGEYGTGASTGETYNPLTNTWTALPAQSFGRFLDSGSMLLANGKVLICPVSPSPSGYTTIFDPATNTWSQGPKIFRGSSTDEQSFVKLPDDSILTIDGSATSERYIPSLNQWIDDAAVPVGLFDGLHEIGPGLRLANGRVMFIGGTSHTALYTPSGTTAPGTWVAGPDLPAGLGSDDAPAALLPDGRVIFALGPTGTYNGPTSFYMYDPTVGAIGQITAVTGAPTVGGSPYVSRMLDLPNGTVLYSSGDSTAQVYDPGTVPLAAAVPTITNVSPNSDGSLTLTGTGINGISAGAAYGDDAQMDSNYPIVRLTAGSNVYYARTYNWSSTGVATGATPETTNFILPLGIPAGSYSLSVVANGIASASVPLSISTTAGNVAPTVATAAAASPAPGTTSNLSVLGADDAGESNLIYTWTTTAAPAGVSLPSFSINGTNASKNTTATFYRIGSYTFNVTITDAGGLSTSSSVSLTVTQTETSITLFPTVANLTAGTTQQFTANALDQFGQSMASHPPFTFSLLSGGGSISASGLYTTPAVGGQATVKVSDGIASATAQVNILSAPWASRDVGSTGVAGSGFNSGATFTLNGSGTDIWGTSDQFQFVYQNLSGDASITARVVTQQNTDPWAKSGVMIRNSLLAGDMMAFMAVTPGNGTNFQYRATASGSAAATTGTGGLVAPYWVRLVRSGNTLTGYRSSNGTTWASQGSTTIAMATNVNVGLEVCAHNNSVLNTSTFDNVTINKPTVATPAAGTPSSVAGTSTGLSVLGADPAGEAGLTYTWAATSVPTGGVATFSGATNGTNAAKNITAGFNKAGQYQFTVMISDGILSVTSAVTVNVSSTLTSIAVSPSSTSMSAGGTTSFSAVANDQFGQPLSAQPSLAWSVTGAGNGITNAGVMTAGTTPGSFTVTAASGAVSGTATATVLQAAIANRAIFYNNSLYDGNDAAANAAADNAAIAPDKSALLPGQAAVFANYTSYDKGINGLILDIANLPAAGVTAADFAFFAGNTTTPGSWAAAPAPASVTVFRGAGVGGSDRIELIWADYSIRNQWLQVTVNANAATTGLATADTFYFGNLVGKTAATTANATVSVGDVASIKFRSGQSASITSPYDLNRDGQIGIGDVVTVKFDQGHVLAFPFTPPAPPAPSAAAAMKAATVKTSAVSPMLIIPVPAPRPSWMTSATGVKKDAIWNS